MLNINNIIFHETKKNITFVAKNEIMKKYVIKNKNLTKWT